MCGIAGIYNFTDENLVKEMLDTIAHRGPDGEGTFMGEKGIIGSRRLAIIDVAHGQMPISNEDGKIWIVYNGEIYNWEKLTEELKAKGHTFKTKSDTEMIIHAYEEWGYEAVKKFNGMFAFALYDSNKNLMWVARDQFGIKPFYYYQDEGKYIFASEIKAITKYKNFKKIPNDKAIFRYLSFRKHDDTRQTFFEGVYKLLPGEYGVFEGSKFTLTKYYDIDLTKKSTENGDELIKKFRELFIKSVKDRLMSEVPIGTCLSGGLDSSAIVCVINYLLKKEGLDPKTIGTKQKTFSAVFPNEINNEEDYINEVLQKTETEKNFCYPKSAGLFEDIEKLIYHQDEPFISSGPYAQWCVMQKAHGKVKVLLDGQGSDELMGGYTPYLVVYLKNLLKEKKYVTFVKEMLYAFPQIKGNFYAKLKNKLSGELNFKDLVSADFAQGFSEKISVNSANLKQRLKDDLFIDSIPALLRYEDKNSMAFSIEGRVPFLDPDLVEFIFSLPANMLIRNGKSKFIMREALKDLLPEKITNRKWKVGFTTPEVAWFREQKEKILAIINSKTFKTRNYFDQEKVQKFVSDFYLGKHNESMVIWRLINLELWLRIFID